MLKTIAATIFLFSSTFSVFAGDFASRAIIGFSKDGTKFAFEEYGVQDGSGFPYSNIYIIDTTTDSWTSGSPWRVRLNNENASIADARFKNGKLAYTSIKNITEKGFVAATNRYTEIPADPTVMRAHPRSFIPSSSDPVEYKLENYRTNAKADCSHIDEVWGFKLTQTLKNNGTIKKRILHNDGSSIPKSRGCPLSYSFADLVTYYPQSGSPVAAILLLKRSYGFEGPDGRYLAVTAPIE